MSQPKKIDALVVGYCEGSELLYVARVRNGFVPALRARVFERFKGLGTKTCPFSNLPLRDRTLGPGTHRRQDESGKKLAVSHHF